MDEVTKRPLHNYALALTDIAQAMRGLGGPGLNQRDLDGLTVLAAELDAVVEGINNLCDGTYAPAN